MKVLFSDRWAPLGFLVALVLFAGLVLHSSARLSSKYPNLGSCLAQPDAHHNRIVNFGEMIVIDANRVERDGLTLTVDDLKGAKPGDHVDLRGRFDRTRSLEVHRIRTVSNYRFKRLAMYAVSFIAIIGLGVLIHRRFRWDLKDGLFEERGDA